MGRFRRPPRRRTPGVPGLPDHLLEWGRARTSRRQRTNRLVGSVRYDRGRRQRVRRGRSRARSPGRSRSSDLRSSRPGRTPGGGRAAGANTIPMLVQIRGRPAKPRAGSRPGPAAARDGRARPTRTSPTAMRPSSATSAVRPDRPADGLARPRMLGLQRPEVSRPAGRTRNSSGRDLRDQDQFQESVFCPGERPVPREFGEGCGRYRHRPEVAWR
jgi:hypothetical protein